MATANEPDSKLSSRAAGQEYGAAFAESVDGAACCCPIAGDEGVAVGGLADGNVDALACAFVAEVDQVGV